MDAKQQVRVVEQAPAPSRQAAASSGLIAILSQFALVDIAIETFWSGSPIRWWVAPPVLVFVALGVWLWRPGGWAAKRRGWEGAASWSIGALLVLLAVTAWLPGGNTNGVRLLLQPTATLLTVMTAAAVILAAFVLVRALAVLPSTARMVARGVLIALAIYAVVALGLAVHERAPFASLFQGGAAWQRLPRWLQGTFIGALVLLPLAILAQIARFTRTLRRKEPVGLLVHQTTALVMAFVMVLPGLRVPGGRPVTIVSTPAAPPRAAEPPAIPAEWRYQSADRLERHFRAAETAQAEIPRATFDLKAVVATVGNDPVKLLEWVRVKTYWVPYRGTLRGATGVLMDRVGNSLDRSLLLAQLLRTGGHDVQLAHAMLSEQQAAAMTGLIRPAPDREGMPNASEDDIRQTTERYARDFQLDGAALRHGVQRALVQSQRWSEEMTRRLTTQVPFLQNAVGNPVAAEQTEHQTIASLRDHWWVQTRDGERWVDLDPLSADAQPAGAKVEAQEVFRLGGTGGTMNLPRRYCHEITVRVVIEQWRAGALVEKVALSHSVRPAETAGQAIVLQNLPLGPPKGSMFLRQENPAAALKAEALELKEWVPSLTVGERSIVQSSFRDDGGLGTGIGTGPAQSRGVGTGGTDMFGGLLGGGKEEEPTGKGILTAQWVDYEIRVPGNNPRIIRREIFDVLGHDARRARPVADPALRDDQRTRRALNLVGTIQILPVNCRFSSEYLQNLRLVEVLQNRLVLSAFAAAVDAGNLERSLEQVRKLKPMFERLYGLAQARFDWSPVGNDVYLDEVNILSYRTALGLDAAGEISLRQGFDIVTNEIAVRSSASARAFLVRLTQGTADTNAEGLLVDATPVANAGERLAREKTSGDAWAVIRSTSDAAWSGLDWTADARSLVERAVSAGSVAIVPRLASTTPWQTGAVWWRINPRTGQTLGMGSHGWGQAAVDRSLLVALGTILTFAVSFDFCLIDQLQAIRNGFMKPYALSLKKCACSGLAVGGIFGAFGAGQGVLAAVIALGAIYQEQWC